MAKTNRYFPEELKKWRTHFRNWSNPWKKKVKAEAREHRKVLNKQDLSEGQYKKMSSDDWHFN
jgi:D-alanyl-D-alanine dipeptidase